MKDTDLVLVDAEIFDGKLHIEQTPIGHAVFNYDGDLISGAYDNVVTAHAFVAGWNAAMRRLEETI